MGRGEFQMITFAHIARGVFEAQLPPAMEAFEYFVSAQMTNGEETVWPPTAPQLCQSVAVW